MRDLIRFVALLCIVLTSFFFMLLYTYIPNKEFYLYLAIPTHLCSALLLCHYVIFGSD
jgi:hypothetical protein